MITTIIFDFFDVFMTDSYKAWLSANGFERTGAFEEASILSDQGKLSQDEFYEKISHAAGQPITAEQMNANATINNELVRFARELRKHYNTGLLSNAPAEVERALLHKYTLVDIFDHIFISGETGLIKPHQEAFENALTSMNVQANETIFIDDNPTNVESAKQLGIHAIVFTSVAQLRIDLTRMGVEI